MTRETTAARDTGGPGTSSVGGGDGWWCWAAARIKELVERVVVVGSLRLARFVPGAYAWRPAPRSST